MKKLTFSQPHFRPDNNKQLLFKGVVHKISLLLLRSFVFFIISLSNVYAEAEWDINTSKTISYANVSGHVTHGDELNFLISKKYDCNKLWNTFTVYTYEKPGDINQLVDKNIPITINGKELTANVRSVRPFLMGYSVYFSLGLFPVEQYVDLLQKLYDQDKKFEITIVDGINFKASKYFDLPINSWNLNKLKPSITQAKKMCKDLSNLDS